VKDQQAAYLPLLLAVFTFHDGTILRLSTAPLSTAQGGLQYGGNDYLARILDQDIAAVQALSEQGIDIIPSVTIHIADADKHVWTNFEKTKGFKGATIVLTFIFWDADSANFSSDSLVKFTGICDPPMIEEGRISVRAANRMNMQKASLPIVCVQKRCPWIFPSTASERQDAADNSDSPFYECGYSQDATGGNARGNLNGAVPFIDCEYTKEACVARGMYITDSAVRVTGRYGGSQWDPPGSWNSRGYLDGRTVEVRNTANDAKYNDHFPLLYGTGWVEPAIMNVVGDANYTKFEAVFCYGYVGQSYVPRVIVNDIEIQKSTPGNRTMWWNWVNDGNRSGAPNADQFYNSLGDPYGSLACIEIVVPKRLQEAAGVPNVRILARGPQLRVYSDATTFAIQYTENPVWIMLELLIRANWNYADIDLATFVTAAAVCDVSINHVDLNGATVGAARFKAALILRQRRSAAEIIRGLRNSCKAILVPNSANSGKLQVYIKQTLADQQPSTVAGSNYDTAITSKNAAGTPTNGFAAYKFDESTILLRNNELSLRINQRPISDSPNRVGFTFQDAENGYAQDSIAQVDALDAKRAGQEIPASIQVDGITTYDQARRIIAHYLAETYSGNPRGDTGGTLELDLETSFRVVHLRVGHLCVFTNTKLGITNQLFRVNGIKPSMDFETVRVNLLWHNDDWYLNTFGQGNAPRYSRPRRDRLDRPPFAWLPYQEQPHANDSLFGTTEWTFGLAQVYENAGDGTAIAKLQVTGKFPINSFGDSVQPPFVPLQGTTASTGGTITGNQTIYAVVCSKDAAGKLSPPHERPVRIDIAAGTNTNTATVPSIYWPSTATGYSIFAGPNPNKLAWQADGATTPTSITLTSLQVATYGVPDGEFDRMLVRCKRVIHSGVWGAQVSAVSTTGITIAGAAFSVNQFAGYDVTIIGRIGSSASLPVWNFRVASNTATVLTFTAGNPSALGVAISDVAVMRSKPAVTTVSGNHVLTDANWVNSFGPSGLAVDAEIGYICRIIAGPGAGQARRIKDNIATNITIDGLFVIIPDSTSRYIIEESNWKIENTTESQEVSDTVAVATVELNVENFLAKVVVVQCLPIDGGDEQAIEEESLVREIYLFGQAASIIRTVIRTAVDITVPAVDAIVEIDTTGGNRIITAPAAADMIGKQQTYKRITGGANTCTIQLAGADTVDGANTVSLPNQWDSFTMAGVV